MKAKAEKVVFGVIVGLMFVLTANPLRAQDANATLSGTVTDSPGKALPNAKVAVKNLYTGQSTETLTDSAGLYTVPNLAPGDYEVSASAEGIGTGVAKVTLTAGSQQTTNLTLTSAPAQASPATPSDNLPNAPTPNKTEPSLEDLGFSKTDT